MTNQGLNTRATDTVSDDRHRTRHKKAGVVIMDESCEGRTRAWGRRCGMNPQRGEPSEGLQMRQALYESLRAHGCIDSQRPQVLQTAQVQEVSAFLRAIKCPFKTHTCRTRLEGKQVAHCNEVQSGVGDFEPRL
jgi:hypothetical protein